MISKSSLKNEQQWLEIRQKLSLKDYDPDHVPRSYPCVIGWSTHVVELLNCDFCNLWIDFHFIYPSDFDWITAAQITGKPLTDPNAILNEDFDSKTFNDQMINTQKYGESQ